MTALGRTFEPAPSAPRRHHRSAAEELDRARSALHAIDPGSDRQTWLRAAMGAKAAGLDEADFIRWSEGAVNFDSEGDCRTVWRSIERDKGIQAGTLFSMARAAGWRDEPNARPRLTPAPRSPQEPRKPDQKAERSPFDFEAVWRDSEPATPDHPYIHRKLGLADGLRVYRGPLQVAGQALDGALLVPVHDAEGGLQSWQAVPAGDGKKVNAPGAAIRGGRFVIGGPVCDGEPIFICEGVGTAWSAHQASGKPAVCTFGIGNAEAVARDLHQRHPKARVVIICDAGKEAAGERIARAVSGAWVEMPAGSAANFDLNDHHQRVQSLQAVADLLAQAREPEEREPRYRLLTAEELAALPPVRWLVRGVLPAEGLGVIFGPPGSGKSFLALDLLAAVAEGCDWFGYRTSAAPVTYLALEGEAGIAQRVQAYRSHHGGTPAAMRFVTQPFGLLGDADIAELAEAIVAAGGAGGIVAIDTLNRASPGADENSSADMGRIIEGAKMLQAVLGGLVLLIHHSGKDAAKGMRGHSSLLAALDAAVEVAREGDRREWRISKSKDSADSEAHPFRLDVVELGIDEDGEPISSCVVAPEAAGTSAAKPAAPGGGNQRVAWEHIGKLLREAGDVRPEGAPDELPQGRPVVRLEAATESVAARLVCEDKRRRERATQAIQGLCGRGLLQHVEGWLWCA